MTDENAPVRLLEPSNPLFTGPNPIGEADWQGWVQDRGLYFAHTWDPAYRPLLEMGDTPLLAASNAGTADQLAARGTALATGPTSTRGRTGGSISRVACWSRTWGAGSTSTRDSHFSGSCRPAYRVRTGCS